MSYRNLEMLGVCLDSIKFIEQILALRPGEARFASKWKKDFPAAGELK